MVTVNIHEAKTHLSRLIAAAVNGEPFVIAKAGKPMVKVTAIEEPEARKPQRIGFLKGKITIPDTGFPEDLPPDAQAELERLWYDGPLFPARRDDAAA